MDRTSFVLACHDMSLFALTIGCLKSADTFKTLEQKAWSKFWWNRTNATAAFSGAVRALFQEKGAV